MIIVMAWRLSRYPNLSGSHSVRACQGGRRYERRLMPTAVGEVTPYLAPITAPRCTAKPSPTRVSSSTITVPMGP